MKIRKQIRKVMFLLQDLDLMNLKKAKTNQINLNRAYDILDNIDAKLEVMELKNKLKEGTNE